MNIKLAEDWKQILEPEFGKDYFRSLIEFVRGEYTAYTIHPKGSQIFSAFDSCPFAKLKVVILGQDPYHGPGQANGLAFSVSDGVRPPPSLVNIFTEVQNDVGSQISATAEVEANGNGPNMATMMQMSGNLDRWAEQGVLLLNSTLTVRASAPGSHQNKGWEDFTDAVIRVINAQKEHVVFLLWGAYAQKKGEIIDLSKHLVLEAPHPSPFSAHKGFLGCKHFSKANVYLQEHKHSAIEW